MAAKVVSFINLKGGVGKTTLALAIGEWLAFGMGAGQKVCLVDIDAQYNLSYALLPTKNLEALWAAKQSMFDMFQAALDNRPWNIRNSIVTSCSNIYGGGHLHTIISSRALGQLDEVVLDRWQSKRVPPPQPPQVDLRSVLGNHLSQVKEDYNWIIIDCPPSLSVFTSNALLCSDYWICPLIPEALSLYGIELIQDRIGELKNKYGNTKVKVEFKGSILNRIDISRKDHQIEAAKVYSNASKYQPFDCWIGDWKPLYIVSDYNYPNTKHLADERTSPDWHSVDEKYGGRQTAENDGGTPEKRLLQTRLGLGGEYRIADVGVNP